MVINYKYLKRGYIYEGKGHATGTRRNTENTDLLKQLNRVGKAHADNAKSIIV